MKIKFYSFIATMFILSGNCILPTISSAQVIAGGGRHSLAVCNDSAVKAWGWNNYGELGDGTYNDSNVPVPVTGLSGIIAIAGGYANSIALKSDGTVWTWGNNTSGELGNGTTGGVSNVPVQVHGPGNVGFLTSIIRIAGGLNHTAALKNDGTVWTWGYNGYGQLGNNTTNNSNFPMQAIGLTGVTAIAAGDGFCLALKSDSTVWSWGYNYYGELGIGSTADSHVPVQITGLTGIITIAAEDGAQTAFALKNDSTAWGWGSNNFGQIGDSTSTDKHVPVQVHGPGNVPFLTGVTAIATGDTWGMALKNDSAWAWGYNPYGQLGDSSLFASGSNVPQRIHGIGNIGYLGCIRSITAGDGHSIALKNDTVLTWGWNSFGQLGDGTTATMYKVPEQVVGMCQALNSVNTITEPFSISVFPNPFENEFTIKGTKEKELVIIFDLTGKEVLRQKTFQGETKINTRFLAHGFYLLSYKEEGKTSNIKLVKF